MTEKNERLKPPARRTGGRTLGGARKAASPPPPPAAELTPEQLAAEEAGARGEGRSVAGERKVQPAPVPVGTSAQGRIEAAPEVAQSSAQPTVEITPHGPVPEPTASQPVHLNTVASEAGEASAGGPIERQVEPAVPAPESAAPAVQPAQSAAPVAQHDLSHVAPPASGAAPAAEVAMRSAVPPVAGGTAFPMKPDAPGTYQEQDARSQEAPLEGTPWVQGPGRPSDIPETAAVLNQRMITRESLDSSVPAALKLKRRLKRFALDNELDHLPIGDIVSVALDDWLSARGF
ncbi:hypothetical protein [Streptomyces sp. NPDC004376]